MAQSGEQQREMAQVGEQQREMAQAGEQQREMAEAGEQREEWPAQPREGGYVEDAAKFVEQDFEKLAAIFCLVLTLITIWDWPPLVALALGALLTALRRYLAGGRYYPETRLDGRTVLVTGATAGLGLETARQLYRRGARVILACRNVSKAELAAHEMTESLPATGGSFGVTRLDLTSLQSVRECAADVIRKEPRLDVLINNAGVMWRDFEKTEDGLELTFQVNHLAPFLLTQLLLDMLKAAPQGRIINLSSLANYFTNGINFANLNGELTFSSTLQYSDTKLMNIAFASELSRRLADTRVTAHSAHPGAVHTELISHLASGALLRPLKTWFYLWPTHKTPEQGVQTTLMLAADPAFAHVSGRYYADCAEKRPHRLGYSPELGHRLWEESDRLCRLAEDRHQIPARDQIPADAAAAGRAEPADCGDDKLFH